MDKRLHRLEIWNKCFSFAGGFVGGVVAVFGMKFPRLLWPWILRMRIDLLYHKLLLPKDPVIGEDPEFIIARVHEANPSKVEHQLMRVERTRHTHLLGHFTFADHDIALQIHELKSELIPSLRIRQFDID